jgi:hypothetical protein
MTQTKRNYSLVSSAKTRYIRDELVLVHLAYCRLLHKLYLFFWPWCRSLIFEYLRLKSNFKLDTAKSVPLESVVGQLQEQNHRSFLFCEKSRRLVLMGEQKQEQIQQMLRHHAVGVPIRM